MQLLEYRAKVRFCLCIWTLWARILAGARILAAVLCLVLVLQPKLARADSQAGAVFEFSGFQAVTLRSFIDVEITIGKPYAIHAYGTSSLLKRLRLKIEEGTLVVDMSNDLFSANSGSLLVRIFMPEAQAVTLIGSGDMRVNAFTGREISLKGSGDMTINNVVARALTISLSGSGDLDVDGRCGLLTATLGGSGDLRAQRLRCNGVDAQLAGSGALHVYAAQAVRASLRGSGDIWVHGKPFKMEANIFGSGDVHRAE
jgi:hypothetical protein